MWSGRGPGLAARPGPGEADRKTLFPKEKEAKDFCVSAPREQSAANPDARTKSFLLLFFKKEDSSFRAGIRPA
jgi:hypothetical protein